MKYFRMLFVKIGLILFCTMQAAYGDTGDVYTANINISGIVIANGSCNFIEDSSLLVDFNEVKLVATGDNIVELKGDYIKPVASDFTCSGDSSGTMQMEFNSSSGSYDNYNGTKVLPTDRGIVSVQLLVNGVAQSMGQWFSIDQKNPPTLQAKLVQTSTINTSNVISGDRFTASGTLVMAFN
ncbi:MrfF [Cronobacter dublinensis]|uniref:MrfF n=1 Tax=Cronobacter dublinensis TaxID=413497 RepID=UPI0029D63D42|nr:MrfF [Cronobacter dublinensis]ELY3969031.1 MrfF [Cronobacter dublinensis]ELY4486697.1 MrfF [Cronobacter dublinensis]ELY5821707.1 MrfF [Cronobacter dublinensis]